MISDDEHQKKYSKSIREARLAGDNQFHSWFNTAQDVHQSIEKGYRDFSNSILTTEVRKILNHPEENTALEIGYVGGRILNAACDYFQQVIGIDIHEEQGKVDTFLKSQGKTNFKLIEAPGRTIDVESETIDFIYSFIVLQHLPTFEVFASYVKETYRSLKPGGVAQLYFGRYGTLSIFDQLRFYRQSYKEIADANPRYVSLVIRLSEAKKLCKQSGFKIIDTGTSYKNIPGQKLRIGGQNYLTLLK